MKNICKIQKHSSVDKEFELIMPHVRIIVDNDDVNNIEVDAAIRVIEKIINENWSEDMFIALYRDGIEKQWKENKWNIQDDYDSYEDYLKQNEL